MLDSMELQFLPLSHRLACSETTADHFSRGADQQSAPGHWDSSPRQFDVFTEGPHGFLNLR